MFRTGKKLDELLEMAKSLKKKLEQPEAPLAKDREETEKLLQNLSEEVSALKKNAARHDETIEDMLDEWNDWRAEYVKTAKALHNYSDLERHTASERTDALLHLIILLHDQLYSLQRAAEEAQDSVWSRQLKLASEAANTTLFQNGLQIFAQLGDSFSYELHEAVSTTKTENPEEDMRIADVLSNGWSDRGKIVRKARVVVYRCAEHEAV